jgi:hypothetical protein
MTRSRSQMEASEGRPIREVEFRARIQRSRRGKAPIWRRVPEATVIALILALAWANAAYLLL